MIVSTIHKTELTLQDETELLKYIKLKLSLVPRMWSLLPFIESLNGLLNDLARIDHR